MASPFVTETEVSRVGSGRYSARIDPVWNLRPLPQGGVVTAIAMRAVAAELDHPDQAPRTLHTTYAAQVAHGEVDVDVEVLRRGRSMSQVRAEVRNVGADRGHLTIASLGGSRRGFDFVDVAPPPDVPVPSDCPSYRDPPPRGSRASGRSASGPSGWRGAPRSAWRPGTRRPGRAAWPRPGTASTTRPSTTEG